tara:strand:- start:1635 stop:2492 length:858 start_codon:yes stop_codon:yes gene_type:complete
MTTTLVEGADSASVEPVASSEPTDSLIHTDSAVSTDSLPASEAPAASDAAPEPEPEKSPEANQEPELTADEWKDRYNQRESSWQKTQSEDRQARESLEQRVAESANRDEQSQLASAILSQRDARQNQLLDSGMEEAQALETANAEARSNVDQYVTARKGQTQSTELEQLRAENARMAQTGSVNHIMTEHGVPASQRALLEATVNATQAEELAQVLGDAEKNRVRIVELTQAQVPVGGEEQRIDSGLGDGNMTNQQIIAAAGSGTFNDLGALDAAMRAEGVHPDQL